MVKIQEELYELELSGDQYSLIEVIISELRDTLPREINDSKIPTLSMLMREHVIYSQDKPLRLLYRQISKELARPVITSVMQPTSLLCALYYLNDLIAMSSAMGVGFEESIFPSEQHIKVMCQFLEMTYKSTEEAYIVTQRYRLGSSNQAARIVPLIMDIIETSYARLGGWRVSELHKKQSNVEEFYVSKAERCMAKGTLLILRWLQQLPEDALIILMGIPLDRSLMRQLQASSTEAIETIARESQERRYRGGNSGTTWLSLRRTISIAPIPLATTPGSATSVASFFSSNDPDEGFIRVASDEKNFSFELK